MERDPRIDPMPGDVFSSPGGRVPEIKVVKVYPSPGGYIEWSSDGITEMTPQPHFSNWAKTATIIKRGDDQGLEKEGRR